MRRRAVLLASLAPALPALARAQSAGLPVKQDDSLAAGLHRDVLTGWGDRVTFDAPPFNPTDPVPGAAGAQFGWDGRVAGMAVPPLASDGVPRAVLAVTHPTVDPAFAWPGGQDRPLVAGAMQGASLLNLERQGGRWIIVDGGYQSRRLTGITFCRLSGPFGDAAGSAVRGVLAPQGGSATPWGTLLLTEGDPGLWSRRLAAVDERFANPRGFGWVIELDPLDPNAVPSKRTALGRGGRGDAAAALARDGRAVVYLTDTRPGGFLFRFTSAGPASAPDALDAGRLAVARLQGDTLQWLPLAPEVVGAPEEAAQQAGGSLFDNPSGLSVDPSSPRLLLACRGSPARPLGHLMEILPAGGDHGADTARAGLVFAGDRGAAAANPDTVTVDARGRAWIGTDAGGRVGPQAQGLYLCDLNATSRSAPQPLYGAPRAASVGGAALTPDGTTLLTVVRHPGAEPGASFERPATRWPAFRPGVPPRSAVIALTRQGGGAL